MLCQIVGSFYAFCLALYYTDGLYLGKAVLHGTPAAKRSKASHLRNDHAPSPELDAEDGRAPTLYPLEAAVVPLAPCPVRGLNH